MKRAARRPKGGFALLVVLWVIAGAAVLSAALTLVGRNGVNAARNRILAERSWWRAQDCFARAHAAMDDVLGANLDPSANALAWQSLGTLAMADILTPPDCAVVIEAAGTRLDVNAADSAQLVAAFSAIGASGAPENLAAAVLDWCDPDDSSRAGGAECDWYQASDRLCPRNGPLADVMEMHRIRGLEEVGGLENTFSVQAGRIAINSAPAAVLATIPGFTDEAIARVLQQRDAGTPVSDIVVFASSLTPPSAAAIAANYPDIVRKATVDPDAWIISSFAENGRPAIRATIEARLVRTERHAALVGLRTW